MRQRIWSRLTYAKVAATLVFLAVLATSTVVALLAFGGGKASAQAHGARRGRCTNE